MLRPKDVYKLYLTLAFIAGVIYLGYKGLNNESLRNKAQPIRERSRDKSDKFRGCTVLP